MTIKIKRKKLIEEISIIPSNLLNEIYDYLDFLKFKKISKDHIETSIASEVVLAKDWLKPEEDKAWENL